MNYVKQRIADADGGRWLSVSWAKVTNDYYSTTLRILAKERSGFIMDVATLLNAQNAKVRSLSARDIGNNQSTANVVLEVKNREELLAIIRKLEAIRGVIEVRRAGVSER